MSNSLKDQSFAQISKLVNTGKLSNKLEQYNNILIFKNLLFGKGLFIYIPSFCVILEQFLAYPRFPHPNGIVYESKDEIAIKVYFASY